MPQAHNQYDLHRNKTPYRISMWNITVRILHAVYLNDRIPLLLWIIFKNDLQGFPSSGSSNTVGRQETWNFLLDLNYLPEGAAMTPLQMVHQLGKFLWSWVPLLAQSYFNAPSILFTIRLAIYTNRCLKYSHCQWLLNSIQRMKCLCETLAKMTEKGKSYIDLYVSCCGQ